MLKTSLKMSAGLLLALSLAACGGLKAGGDTTAPSVKLSSPDGEPNPQLVSLSAEVTDISAITKVAFYRNGNLLGEDTTAPYTWKDIVTADGTYTYQAFAYDAAGNRGQSNDWEVKLTLPEKITSVSGTLQDAALTYPLTPTAWTGGAGTLTLLDTATGTALTSAPIASDGTFRLGLSKVATLTDITTDTLQKALGLSGCTGTVTATPSTRIGLTRFMVQAAGRSGVAAPVKLGQPAVSDTGGTQVTVNYPSVGLLVYSEKPSEVQGTLTCPHADTTTTRISFNIVLLQGWNKLTRQYVINSGAPRIGEISFANDFPTPEIWTVLSTALWPQ